MIFNQGKKKALQGINRLFQSNIMQTFSKIRISRHIFLFILFEYLKLLMTFASYKK